MQHEKRYFLSLAPFMFLAIVGPMQRTRGLLTGLRLLRPLLHVVAILCCFYGMILLRAHTDLIPGVQLRIPPIAMGETMGFAGIAAMLFVIIGSTSSLYSLFWPVQQYYKRFLGARGLWTMIIGFVAFMGFGYVFTNGISRFVLVFGACSFLLVGTILDVLQTLVQQRAEHRNPYRVLILGSQDLAHSLAQILHEDPAYVVDTHSDGYADSIDPSYDIVVAAGTRDIPILQDIADTASIQGQRLYLIGDELFLEDLIAQPQRLGPLVALSFVPSTLDGWRRVIKRLFDIIGACIGLFLLIPIYVLIAIAIKLDTSGPVLYTQQRVGKKKNLFTFIKFRSMYTHLSVGDAYGGAQAQEIYTQLIHSDQNVRDEILPKIENDPRITRVGRFLRKTSLDELPSLWSVLRGDMSLVGPRPHMPSEVDRYDRRQQRLFSVKPGITGYAQIFGRDTLPFEQEAQLDLYYIQNRSLAMDIFVLINTLRVVFSGR